MHAFVKSRIRNASVSAIAPPITSPDHSVALASLAAKILYRSPLPSLSSGLPIFILNSAALPSAKDVSFDALLPYVLSRLPDEDELIGGKGYEVVFFAGGEEGGSREKEKPSPAWMFRAYHVLSRATRKRLMRLWIVHERRWVRVCVEALSAVVSPKFRRKVAHVSSLQALSVHVPLEDLLIPPAVHYYDRAGPRKRQTLRVRRAFGVAEPLPVSADGSHRLPRVLRESTSFLLLDKNIRTEGLFRVSARVVAVDILADAYDRGQKFVVWKEGDSVLTFPHFQEALGDIMPGEIEQTEGFGIHAAAGLIKRWYAELKEPIFPTSSYAYMKEIYGQAAESTLTTLYEYLKPDTDPSHILSTSRQILTSHLLPLLAKVAENQDFNHMTPKNLARCVAPNLIRGSNSFEEVEMAEIVSSFLQSAVSNWKALSSQLGLDDGLFLDSLRIPEAIRDREDPPEQIQSSETSGQLGIEDELNGITMVDYDEDMEGATELDSPVLPPRPETTISCEENPKSAVVLRKPAPALKSSPLVADSSAVAASAGVDRATYDLEDSATGNGEPKLQIPSSVARKPVSNVVAPSD